MPLTTAKRPLLLMAAVLFFPGTAPHGALAQDASKPLVGASGATPVPKGAISLKADGPARAADIGTVRSEDEILHVFQIVNDTGERVVVGKLTTSCGCTLPVITRTVLSSGETAELRVRIATGPDAGSKTILARTEGTVGGKPAQFDFHVRMRIVPVISFPSEGFEIGLGKNAASRAPIAADINIARGPNPMEWDGLRVESGSPQITVLVDPEGGDKWRVRLAIDPQRRIGPFAANLTFHVLNRGADTGYAVSRRVSTVITGPVRAAPSSWLVGQAPPGQPVEQSIHIISAGSEGEQPEFLGATPSNPKTIETVKNAAEKDRFTIRYTPPNTLGPDSGYVDARVSTRHGNYTIRISYLALVVPDEPATAGPTPTLAPPKGSDDSNPSP